MTDMEILNLSSPYLGKLYHINITKLTSCYNCVFRLCTFLDWDKDGELLAVTQDKSGKVAPQKVFAIKILKTKYYVFSFEVIKCPSVIIVILGLGKSSRVSCRNSLFVECSFIGCFYT